MEWWVFFIALFVVTSFMFLLICKITILENRIAYNDGKIYALSTELHTVVSQHMPIQNSELTRVSAELNTVKFQHTRVSVELNTLMSQHIPCQNQKISNLTDHIMHENTLKDKVLERLLECESTIEKIQAEIKTLTPKYCEFKFAASHVAVINNLTTLKDDVVELEKIVRNLQLVLMNPEAAKLYNNFEGEL